MPGRFRIPFLVAVLCTVPFARVPASDDTASHGDGPGPSVRVVDIQFDHAESAALPLRENFTKPIPKPEWVDGIRSGAALFVRNSPVVVLAHFEADPGVAAAFIWAESAGPLGGLKGRFVDFTVSSSTRVPFAFAAEQLAPDALGSQTWHWQWMAGVSWKSGGVSIVEMNTSGEHGIYTVLETPGLPWKTDVSGTQNPWSEALDFVFKKIKADTTEEALDEATKFCFDRPCFNYDTVSGAPVYIQTWKFNLTLFLQDMNTSHSPRTGCCYDGGAIVHTLAGLVGAKTYFVLSGVPYTAHAFGYQPCIDPIGSGLDYSNNPFFKNSGYRKDPVVYQDGTSSSCKRSYFANHGFASLAPGSHGVIWDATMCADTDDNPDTLVQYPPDGGYTSTDLSRTVLTDATANWTPNQWIGMYLNPNTNRTKPNPYKEYPIVGNTQTQIAVAPGSNMVLHAKTGDNYWIRDPNDPSLTLTYMTGFPWIEFESLAVDDNGSGTHADPPVIKPISIK